MIRRRLLRGGLTVLGLLHLIWGVAAVAAPRRFFDAFPGFGPGWTAAYPPFNEHLMVDVGAAFTAFGVLLLLAATLVDRRVTAVVLTGVVVFSAIHLGYHAVRHGDLAGATLAASLVSLLLGVLVPLALLWINQGTPHRSVRASARSGA